MSASESLAIVQSKFVSGETVATVSFRKFFNWLMDIYYLHDNLSLGLN
jgi:hypothetical protein